MNQNTDCVQFARTDSPASKESPLFKPRQKLIPQLPAKRIELPEPFEAYSELKFMRA